MYIYLYIYIYIYRLYLLRHYMGNYFKLHSNLEVSHSILCKFPKLRKEIFIRWGKHRSLPATLSSTVACFFGITKAFISIISRTGI